MSGQMIPPEEAALANLPVDSVVQNNDFSFILRDPMAIVIRLLAC